MRAYPHGDGRGARLNGDDLAALRYLYPIGDGTEADDHGDTFADATSIGVPSTTSGHVGARRRLRLLPSGGSLGDDADGGDDGQHRHRRRLYDSNQAPLVSEDDDGGNGVNFRIERQVAAGTYYVRVRGIRQPEDGGVRVAGDRGRRPLRHVRLRDIDRRAVHDVGQSGAQRRLRLLPSGGSRCDETGGGGRRAAPTRSGGCTTATERRWSGKTTTAETV